MYNSLVGVGPQVVSNKRTYLFCALLFLFPIGNFVVSHWLSTIFLILAVASLFGPWFSWSQLKRAEKGLLFLSLAYFGAFVLSGLVNEAGPSLVKRLGVELRYLFIVPLYLVVRNIPDASRWLLRGCALGGAVFAANACYEFFIAGKGVVAGAYHHILYGTIAAAYSVLLWNQWWSRSEAGFWHWGMLLGSLASILTVILSGSRTAYVVLLAVALLWGVLYMRGRSMLIVVAVVLCTALLSYALSDRVSMRVHQAVDDVVYYFSLEDPSTEKQGLPSVALRFEMWRTALLIIRDNPWLGVSREGYPDAASRYVDQGKVHWQAPQQGQPHNAYLEVLVSMGVIGFIPFVGMLFFPVVTLWGRAAQAEGASAGTVLFLAAYATTSLAAAAPFIRGNAVAIFVVFLAVLMADAMRQGEPTPVDVNA